MRSLLSCCTTHYLYASASPITYVTPDDPLVLMLTSHTTGYHHRHHVGLRRYTPNTSVISDVSAWNACMYQASDAARLHNPLEDITYVQKK